MEFWERNLAVLARWGEELLALAKDESADESLCIEAAKNGEPVVRVAGVCLHSAYDPSREAAGWLAGLDADPARPLTVLGFGLGYQVRALAEAGFSGYFIEPDPRLFRLALRHLDLTLVLDSFQPLVGIPLENLRRAHRDLLGGEIVVHPASRRINAEYFAGLSSFCESLARVRTGGLKILLINPVYGGSLPAARHSAAALEQLGHEVQVFSADAFAAGMQFADNYHRNGNRKNFLSGLEKLLSMGIELLAAEFEPDLVIALAQAPLHQQTLVRLREMGIPTAFWFVEDYRVLPYWREVAAGYSYFFAIQQGEFPAELDRSGAHRHAYLPPAAAPHIHRHLALSAAEREEFGSPLSFVGAGYYNRQSFFRGLLDYPFKIWGSDWPLTLPLAPHIQKGAARIDTETCVKIFNASSINLNLHSSTHHEGVDPTGDFVNPRTFELAACGAFQLVDRRSLLGELFADDELETFGSMAELRDKIDTFLTNPAAGRIVAEKGRRRVLAEHTYEARMEELLSLMVAAFPVIAEKQERRREARAAFLDEVESCPGVGDILTKIPGGRTVRLPDIYGAIEESQGELSRAEKIFLMLKNIEVAQEVRG